MTIEEREVWLQELTIPQLMALACQRSIVNWHIKTPEQLVKLLSPFEDIEVPIQA